MIVEKGSARDHTTILLRALLSYADRENLYVTSLIVDFILRSVKVYYNVTPRKSLYLIFLFSHLSIFISLGCPLQAQLPYTSVER